MSRIRIESKDGRVVRINLDSIVAVDYQNGDNFINIITLAGTWSVYFSEIEIKRLDNHAQTILSGGRLSSVDTIVFSK